VLITIGQFLLPISYKTASCRPEVFFYGHLTRTDFQASVVPKTTVT